MTQPHDDRIKIGNQDYGYSIRIGSKVPSNAVNLAYVHMDPMAPKKNLLITDVSDQIIENTITTVQNDVTVFPDEDFLLRELSKPFYLSSKNIAVTDEFYIPSTPQEMPTPLYYKAEVKGLFDASGATVSAYPSGYVERPITDAVDYSQLQLSTLLYMGKKIQITKIDGSPLDSSKRYKIQLLKQTGAGIPPDAYRIVVYTNFRGNEKESFLIRYEKYNVDRSHVNDTVEILNAYPFFTEVSKSSLDSLATSPKNGTIWKPELQGRNYAVSETADQKWEVYAPSQVLIANNATRPAQHFEYRIRGKLRARMDSSNTGMLNVGIVYLNDNIFGVEDLSGAIKRMYEDPYKPPYLDFKNPHPPAKVGRLDRSTKYWQIDLSMPADYLNDYDLIIITGYGTIDVSLYNDALRTYLQNGGRLWIDNAGDGSKVLKLDNFLTNITFSITDTINANKNYGIPDGELSQHDEYSIERRAINRLYLLDKTNLAVGYPNINPVINFGDGESESIWIPIVRYTSNNPSVITRPIFGEGQIIVSNCGIFRSLMNRESDDIKLVMNIILSMAEEKTVATPWLREYVYHRDNLFKEEYTSGDHDVYVDDRSDIDSTQIIAKKVLNKRVRDALIPYMPSSYYRAKGTFKAEVKADSIISVQNSDFEVGTYTSGVGATISWTTNMANAIPGWNTKIISGTSTFEHVSSISQRGKKAIRIVNVASASSYWTSNIEQLPIGTYNMTVWLKTDTISSTGVKVSIHNADGIEIGTSPIISGTQDWVEVQVTFGITTPADIQMQIGFISAGTGTVWIDYAQLVSIGSIFMTPDNDGDTALYAYSVRADGEIFDLKGQGFTNADVTVYDPEIDLYCIVKSFVYKWDNALVQYVREYGNASRTLTKIRRSDGAINVDLLTTLVPDMKAGPEWADKTKVFFEVLVQPVDNNTESNFVNIAFFNKQSGRYYYSETGENIIGYSEIYNGIDELNLIVQAWTDYYTIRATKRRYAVKVQGDERIYLEYPATIDDRDPWFVRVRNGSFVKNGLNYREHDQFKDFYTTRRFGSHKYLLPEYDKQLFKPGQPFRRVRQEVCEYVDDQTIRVQHAPLYIQSGKVVGEVLTAVTDSSLGFTAQHAGHSFALIQYAEHGKWLRNPAPKIYMDNDTDGVFVPYMGSVSIDYENGIVYFAQNPTGVAAVDYSYNNFELYKRVYGNGKIKREQLISTDKKTFLSKNKNWLIHPNPIVYQLPEGVENEKDYVALIDTYMINYEDGSVIFYENISDRIFVDYNYSVDKLITVKDYDVQSGLVHLDTPISFKDELYTNYYYEENFVEYRGYFDSNAGQFIHLDLNPSEGHYCTMPLFRTDPVTKTQKIIRFDNMPTAKLMNKEVYIYLVPYMSNFLSDVYYFKEPTPTPTEPNNYVIRHCYSKAEWNHISKCMPGVAILLGVIQLREHTTVEQATVLDTRSRGGGLKTSVSRDAIKKIDPLATNFWDIGPWEGQAYYSNGVIIIQLPNNVLKANGGQFTEKDIDEIINRYVALGVYCIVEYVEPAPIPEPIPEPDTTPPNDVTDLAANSITETTLTLNWTASNSSDVVEYDLYQDSTLLGSTTTMSYDVTGLLITTPYAFTVKTKDKANNISSGVTIVVTMVSDITPPNEVTNLAAGNIIETTLKLTWTASTSTDIAGYDVLQGTTLLGSVTTTSYDVIDLLASTQYTFTIKAKDTVGNISSGSSIVATTATPMDTTAPNNATGLTTSNLTAHTVTLSWTASDSLDVASYNIYNGGAILGNTATTTYAVTGLNDGVANTLMVQAVDASGNLSTGATTVVTPPDVTGPVAVTNIVASNITETSFHLSWSLTTDNVGVKYYYVYLNDSYLTLVSNTTTSIDATQLTPSTTYKVSVKAQDTASNYSADSWINVTTLVSTDTTPPDPITNLQASYIHSSELLLSWTNSLSTDTTGYVVYKNGSSITTTNSSTNYYNVTGLTVNTSYTFMVKAKDAAGNLSSPVQITVSTLATATPPYPSLFKSSSTTYNQHELWYGGSSGYKMQFTDNIAATWTFNTSNNQDMYYYHAVSANGGNAAGTSYLQDYSNSNNKFGTKVDATQAGISHNARCAGEVFDYIYKYTTVTKVELIKISDATSYIVPAPVG